MRMNAQKISQKVDEIVDHETPRNLVQSVMQGLSSSLIKSLSMSVVRVGGCDSFLLEIATYLILMLGISLFVSSLGALDEVYVDQVSARHSLLVLHVQSDEDARHDVHAHQSHRHVRGMRESCSRAVQRSGRRRRW